MDDIRNDFSTNSDNQSLAIEPIESMELDIVDKQQLDELLHDKKSIKIDYNGIDTKDRINALIPLAPDVASAIQTSRYAMLKFPPGNNYGDLVGRTTPGLEGWKSAMIQGEDGKVAGQVAIKQVGLSPTMVATLGFQIATVVVGQQYMSEIDHRLEKIGEELETIQSYLEADHNSKITGTFRSLQGYLNNYSEYIDNPEKRIAAKSELERLRNETNNLWEKGIELLKDQIKKLDSKKYFSEKDIRTSFEKLDRVDASLLATFQLILAAEKISMQYDGDFSSKRIDRVRKDNKELSDSYLDLRENARESLRDRIDELKNPLPFAFPGELEDDGYKNHHIVTDTAHDVGRFLERVTSEAPWDAAKHQLKERKDELHSINNSESDFMLVDKQEQDSLEQLDFIFNKATAFIEEGDGIRFISE